MTDADRNGPDLLTRPRVATGRARAPGRARPCRGRVLGRERLDRRHRHDHGHVVVDDLHHRGRDHHDDCRVDRSHRDRLHDHPRGDGGPFPGDGSNGPDVLTESGVVRRTSAPASARRGTADGVPLHDRTDGRRTRATAARRWPAPRSTCGTATATATTRCTPSAPPTRTTCAACRRPTPTASSRSPASSPRATRVAGRTCTSRCTRASPRRRRRATTGHVADRPPGGRLQRRVRDARLRAERAQPGPRCRSAPTWCSATACPRDADHDRRASSGYVSSLVVGVSGAV